MMGGAGDGIDPPSPGLEGQDSIVRFTVGTAYSV